MRQFIIMNNKKLNLFVNIGEILNYNYHMHDIDGEFDFEELPNDLEKISTIVALKNNLKLNKNNNDVNAEELEILNGLLQNDNSYNVEFVDKIKNIDLVQQFVGKNDNLLEGHFELDGYINIVDPKTNKILEYGEKYYTRDNFTKALLFEVTDLKPEEVKRIIYVLNYLFQNLLSHYKYSTMNLNGKTKQRVTTSIIMGDLMFESVVLTMN